MYAIIAEIIPQRVPATVKKSRYPPAIHYANAAFAAATFAGAPLIFLPASHCYIISANLPET